MSDIDPLSAMYPRIGRGIGRVRLAKLPTPLREHAIPVDGGSRPVWVKHDEETSERYGGNKVRKLEYLLCPRNAQAARRFATFGTVGSHHALATALHARALGYECSCFLAHQSKAPGIAAVLGAHAAVGTEIVRYGGAYAARIATLRKHLWHRQARVVPAGGSSWHGTLGFVNAALELA
ncbi:MAG: pyridoxal-phosphate dependent enzyme, partial [Woeseiaceae bacterium]